MHSQTTFLSTSIFSIVEEAMGKFFLVTFNIHFLSRNIFKRHDISNIMHIMAYFSIAVHLTESNTQD